MTATELNTIVALINREADLHMDRADTYNDTLKAITANITALELLSARDALEDLMASR